jgi:hypothetical protein
MLRIPCRISARRAWDDDEKMDQTVLTAVWSARGRASMDWQGIGREGVSVSVSTTEHLKHPNDLNSFFALIK